MSQTRVRAMSVPRTSSAKTKFPPESHPCDYLLVEENQVDKNAAERLRKNNKHSRKSVKSSEKHQPNVKIFSKKEFEELKKRSGEYKTKEERRALAVTIEMEKERKMKEVFERKEAIRRMDMKRSREKNAKLSEIEEEARKRTMHILERAYNLRLEQEEEIQKCNRIILETKCRAIRDAQIAERELIKREMEEEEKRLNEMMENERRWALKEELKKEEEEVAKRQKFAKILKDQITENEEQRILEFERKQEESRLINLSNAAWQEEEKAKVQSKEAENARIRQELYEINEQLKHFKALEEEENRIIDMRIKEYQKLQDKRAAELAEEQRLERLKREREREKVAMQAMHAQDLQVHIDEINIARVREEVEREWRKKEKAEALRRAEAQRQLKIEREKQINTKKMMQAIEIERDRREFERVLSAQKEALSRMEKEQEKKQQNAIQHRREILKQVNEKERERIQTRQKMFEEGLAIRTEAAIRKKKLQEAMERKCREMRENKVPETYINEVKRMIDNIR